MSKEKDMSVKGITLPCPFCQRFDELYVDTYETETHLLAKVKCDNCLCSGPMHGWLDGDDGLKLAKWHDNYHENKEDVVRGAIHDWNNRIEKTCHNLNDPNCRSFICSECGKSTLKDADDPEPEYCSHCRAKVVRR